MSHKIWNKLHSCFLCAGIRREKLRLPLIKLVPSYPYPPVLTFFFGAAGPDISPTPQKYICVIFSFYDNKHVNKYLCKASPTKSKRGFVYKP